MTALVIDGHPNPDSLTASLARRYAEAHGDATVLAVRDLAFDPNLRLGYQGEQQPEPDIARAQELIAAADHVVIAAPVWWGSIPAVLKGFIDRTFLPGWAFRYRKGGLVTGLLAGRSARVIITTDSPMWYLQLVGDTTVRHVRGRVLRFSGFARVTATRFGPVRGSSPAQRSAWLEKVATIAASDATAAQKKLARQR
ncbi:NAD(P)H-dependent oxidoreductase [Microcella sp.]|uniref:NAD(P)H-dependent oxidoreductase n=1 Tax=Microcella sp. TaxID=1913979 RepID=UPI002564EA27|nr:NAD(P)H-dependent oxidoreductase [Microcella sp.]MBX9471626.1 NAD(P)H-dependent oxidoreductase [Microcella sp.]